MVRLEIEDDGKGFSKERGGAHGIGVRIMRHRAKVIGATFIIKSIRGKGVYISRVLKKRA
jgi:signal transduction histidine kinase